MFWIMIITAFVLNTDGTQNYVGIRGSFSSQEQCVVEMNRLKPMFDVSQNVSASCTNSSLTQEVTGNVTIIGVLVIQ